MKKLNQVKLLQKIRNDIKYLSGIELICIIERDIIDINVLNSFENYIKINFLEKNNFFYFDYDDFFKKKQNKFNGNNYIFQISYHYFVRFKITNFLNFINSWRDLNSSIEIEFFDDHEIFCITESSDKNILFYSNYLNKCL